MAEKRSFLERQHALKIKTILLNRSRIDRDGEHLIHFAKFAVVFCTGVTSFVYRIAQGLTCGGETKFSWNFNFQSVLSFQENFVSPPQLRP